MIKFIVDPFFIKKAITIFSDFTGASYTSNKDIVGLQRFAPTYKHLNYNIYLFPWFEKIPTVTKGKVMWAITRTPKLTECIGNFKNDLTFIKFLDYSISAGYTLQLRMHMDPLKTISPKSMKDRFCFDPHKIPTGTESDEFIYEWGYTQGTSEFFKDNIHIWDFRISFDFIVEIFRGKIEEIWKRYQFAC